jgi:hypothetical protein
MPNFAFVKRMWRSTQEPGCWWLVHIPENGVTREEVCKAIESRFPWFTVEHVRDVLAAHATTDSGHGATEPDRIG